MYDPLKDAQATIKTLKESSLNVSELEVSLNAYTFTYDADTNEPFLTNGIDKYYFDIENTYAFEQFCSHLKVKQFLFFTSLSKKLQEEIIQEKFAKLSPKKAKVLVKLRKGKDKTYLRAVLSQKYVTVDHYEVFEALEKEIEDRDGFTCRGYALDEPSLEAIYLLKTDFEKDYQLGIQILSSEVGDHKLELNGIIYDQKKDLVYLVSFNNKPFYQWAYRGDEPNLNEKVTELYGVLISKKGELKDRLTQKMKDFYKTENELFNFFNKLELEKVGPPQTFQDLKVNVLENRSDYKTLHSLATFVSMSAEGIEPGEKDFHFWRGRTLDKINKNRRFAGYLLDFNFIGETSDSN